MESPKRNGAASLLDLENPGGGNWQESDAVVRCDNLNDSRCQRPCMCLPLLMGVTRISAGYGHAPVLERGDGCLLMEA